LAAEATAKLAFTAVKMSAKSNAIGRQKRTNLTTLRSYFNTELPTAVVRDVLDVCLARDRFRCHHNPTECLALELWRVFYNDKFTNVTVSHHAFAFPKTTNYPDIVYSLEELLHMIGIKGNQPTDPKQYSKMFIDNCFVLQMTMTTMLDNLLHKK
jgi:hypothetical protein